MVNLENAGNFKISKEGGGVEKERKGIIKEHQNALTELGKLGMEF